MPDRSTLAFSDYRTAERKFDYFITGVAGALFAYLAPQYEPIKLSISPTTLEPITLIFLALAFYFGMKRIQAVVYLAGENYTMLSHQEKSGDITKAIQTVSSEYISGYGESKEVLRVLYKNIIFFINLFHNF